MGLVDPSRFGPPFSLIAPRSTGLVGVKVEACFRVHIRTDFYDFLYGLAAQREKV